ncbi:MAG: hypothetical protein KBD17_00895 [Candidatus Pacebacteria bacterium]|nr:hypothetical protein [Candidatus Paceibacterota bacterium]
MKLIKQKLPAIILLLLIIILPVVSFVEASNTPPSTPPTGENTPVTKINNPLGDNNQTIETFILKFLKGIIKLGIPIVALAVIYCGFLFVKAQGNAEELTKAKDALLYTLIGAGILLGAIAITELVINTVKSVAS